MVCVSVILLHSQQSFFHSIPKKKAPFVYSPVNGGNSKIRSPSYSGGNSLLLSGFFWARICRAARTHFELPCPCNMAVGTLTKNSSFHTPNRGVELLPLPRSITLDGVCLGVKNLGVSFPWDASVLSFTGEKASPRFDDFGLCVDELRRVFILSNIFISKVWRLST